MGKERETSMVTIKQSRQRIELIDVARARAKERDMGTDIQ